MEYSYLITDFLDDADAHLKEVDSALLSLEKNGQNKKAIFNTLGSLHTLKANSGMMGFESLKLYVKNSEREVQGR